MSLEQYRPSRFNLMPAVTKNIIIINAIMFLATSMMERTGTDLNDLLGLHYFQSEKFHIWQFITYMFMHGSLMHIFFNMFALWMFGTAVENMWGPKRFLNYYILTGLGAAAAHFAIIYYQLSTEIDFDKISALINTPVIGASGAVFGILVAFGMYFPNTHLFILPIPFPIKAKYAVILYGLVELFAGVANFSGDNIAHFAHLGGLISGFIMIQIWKHNDHSNY